MASRPTSMRSQVTPMSPAPPPSEARHPLVADPFDEAIDGGEQRTDEERMEELQKGVSSVIDHLTSMVTDRISKRANIESRWLKTLRQYHGLYEADVEGALANDDERSKAFINMTRPKTTAWEARLWDMLFPADDKNWGINPTPVPELGDQAAAVVEEALQLERQAAQLAEENNALVDQGAPEAQRMPVLQEAEQVAQLAKQVRDEEKRLRAIQAEAKKRAESMQMEIDDDLTECNYAAVARDVIHDACKLGVGVIKGPFVANKSRGRWQAQINPVTGNVIPGQYVLHDAGKARAGVRRVDPWNFLPDMDATSMADNESTFERHIKNKTQFRRMAKELDFDKETVRKILRNEPDRSGHGDDLNFLSELRALEEDKSPGTAISGKYVVYEYHGPLEIEQVVTLLRGMGQADLADEIEQEDDPLVERMVVVYFCQGLLLKIAPDYPMDSGDSLYSVFSFEKAEASILGAVGVPHLMRHEQAMLNSAVRMMLDNGALSVGPQIVVDSTQVEPENGSWKLTPRKVWKKRGQEVGNSEPFRIYNIPMNQTQLAAIIDLAMRFIDIVISMPMLAQGEQGQHQANTLGGMSMLFNSANVVFRRVVKNWDDDITGPLIRRFFDWQMQFSKKEHIKGDMQVEARGTSVLLVREIQSQQLMAIATNWSTHPIIGPALRVYDTLRMTLQAMAINPSDILCEPDEFERRVQAMAEGGEESPDVIRAQAQIEVAKIRASSDQMNGQISIEVANINRQTEIMKLIQKDGVDLAKLETLLKQTEIKTASEERKFAAELGAERQAQEEARAQGMDIDGSGGAVNLAPQEV